MSVKFFLFCKGQILGQIDQLCANAKKLLASRGFTPDQGPWTTLGALPQTSVIGALAVWSLNSGARSVSGNSTQFKHIKYSTYPSADTVGTGNCCGGVWSSDGFIKIRCVIV